MTIDLARLASDLVPERTVLFFGAGACLASHAPSVQNLITFFEGKFHIPCDGYSLREYTSILESKIGRKILIESLRLLFKNLRPTGSLLNIPLYDWKSIYTTNYDTLIEQCYLQKKIDLTVFESNFDFTIHNQVNAVKLFKLHGSIDKDVADGHAARIILTDSDYDHTQTFREGLYDRFKSDLYGANLVIIGHSLADEDIKSIANRAAEIASKSDGVSKITLLMYQHDDNRAELWEKRGFQVSFGGLDEFFSMMAKKLPQTSLVYEDAQQPLDHAPRLRPITIDVSHAANGQKNISNMFNGWPASYADIEANLTLNRTISSEISDFLVNQNNICAAILGASGLGKTTSARQVLLQMQKKGFFCWEHKGDFEFPSDEWIKIARSINKYGSQGILFIDEAHSHLHGINRLFDTLASERIFDLKILLVSTKNHWNPRIKSSAFFKFGKEFSIGKLRNIEIDLLLNLIDSNPDINALVGETFSGFSRYEKRRRLIERCESETFVCLKNIFSSEKFDDILLREYALLDAQHQDIYRIVAAMESSGIRVHRQLVIRLLGIPAASISAALNNLTDIITEYAINEKEGIYGWKGRHSVIVNIITQYKYYDIDSIIELFDKVIDSISPTFDIEVRSIRELCNIETGLQKIGNKEIQNRLLRKMMSIAPAERVPRHRLIRNLLEMGEFEKSDSEIRIFEKDFGRDAPVTRYKIKVLISRALDTTGILSEDRMAILNQAKESALAAISRYPENRTILSVYCDVGIAIYRQSNDYSTYDDAIQILKQAESRVGDPEISKIIQSYERKMAGQVLNEQHFDVEANEALSE